MKMVKILLLLFCFSYDTSYCQNQKNIFEVFDMQKNLIEAIPNKYLHVVGDTVIYVLKIYNKQQHIGRKDVFEATAYIKNKPDTLYICRSDDYTNAQEALNHIQRKLVLKDYYLAVQEEKNWIQTYIEPHAERIRKKQQGKKPSR